MSELDWSAGRSTTRAYRAWPILAPLHAVPRRLTTRTDRSFAGLIMGHSPTRGPPGPEVLKVSRVGSGQEVSGIAWVASGGFQISPNRTGRVGHPGSTRSARADPIRGPTREKPWCVWSLKMGPAGER